MNRQLEVLILAYEAAQEARGASARRLLAIFEAHLDDVIGEHPGLSREILRKSVIKAHRAWALKQANKPPYIPPKA